MEKIFMCLSQLACPKKQDDSARKGFASSLQWESEDKTILLTGEFIRSEATLAWSENVIEMDDGDSKASLLPVAGTQFEFDENGYFEKRCHNFRSRLAW